MDSHVLETRLSNYVGRALIQTPEKLIRMMPFCGPLGMLTCIANGRLAPLYEVTSSRSTVAVMTSTSSNENWEPWANTYTCVISYNIYSVMLQ